MRRFICQPQDITPQHIKISDKDELHHLKNVLRLKIKDKIIAMDGKGREFICELEQFDKKQAKLRIVKEHCLDKDKIFPKLSVACALPKGPKVDFIVEKLTEIGAERIILLKTQRTEVIWKDYFKKLERLKKISEAALKQSGNLFLPEILLLDFKGLLEFKGKNGFDLALIPNLTDDARNIKEVLENSQAKNILAAIGPEGDFSAEEIGLAEKAGFVSVRLTDSVLKVDTAAIAVASFIKIFYKQHIGH
ncbi:MAG: RsmE family RNA methyltransferase [Candidatus Omnitrophica bacterium]|nr:RsmE family RNA methyltransferase [Candidatus Omnitrophota bacterium]